MTVALTALIIAGAGGFGRESLEVARAMNAACPVWDIAGFVDDDPLIAGTEVAGVSVIGPIADALLRKDTHVVVTTGRPTAYHSRLRIVRLLRLPDDRWATLTHPHASIAPSTRIGPGSVVLAGVVTTAQVAVGAHVAVMPQCVLTHDVSVGDFATLATGVRLSGGVTVGEGAYVGAGACVREGCRIGAWSMVGMGSVVLTDIPAGEVWVGVPARRLRRAEVPHDLVAGAA